MRRRHSLPAAVYSLVDHTPATVLLEGASSKWARLFTAPVRICVAYRPAELHALFREIETALQSGYSAAGFFSYECAASFEPKATTHANPEAPLAWIGIYNSSYVFNYETGSFIDGDPPGLEPFRRGNDPDEFNIDIHAEFSLTEDQHAASIAAIHDWIRAGDVYQLNFTAPWRIYTAANAAQLYAHLRTRQPARYGAFLHCEADLRILSFSPELFFRIDSEHGARRIVTRPMKGTAPRARTTAEDRERAEWLRNDPKNRSENVMIVDLLRNDLGRVARFGTVHVEELFAVERYPTLWQMTSTIAAELRDDVDHEAVFRALFPCGSVTGAPKVRAMQLISQLEDHPRGVYTGAIGYFSPECTIFNVAIRTLSLNGNSGTMGAGSGIVIDSSPAEEYRECLLKASFLTQATDRSPQEFSLIETMLWNGAYPLLDLHLDRLTDSADYFDFLCDRTQIRRALEDHARSFADTAPRKVRLLLDRDGNPTLADELLPTSTIINHVGRVRIASERTDPSDAFLFHKTTHRPLYAAAFQQAVREGFDDVLFFNRRGELTEGAISNVFVEKDGRLFTPPISCGLLPGVHRRYLLATRKDIEERILCEDDVRNADAIHLSNAVRGLRQVHIDW
ncbi:MAG TPA: aminodeoxychorismate synthase component I [Terracidiphilus sp.]|nr:aminodeoxychorismate synthase component I [Terracidiphilus sp.]